MPKMSPPLSNQLSDTQHLNHEGESLLNRYRAIIDHLPYFVLGFNALGKCTYCNQSWMKLTGQKQELALEDGWLTSINAEDQSAAQHLVAENIAQSQITQGLCRVLVRDLCTTVTSVPKAGTTENMCGEYKNHSLLGFNEDSESRATPYLGRAVGHAEVPVKQITTGLADHDGVINLPQVNVKKEALVHWIALPLSKESFASHDHHLFSYVIFGDLVPSLNLAIDSPLLDLKLAYSELLEKYHHALEAKKLQIKHFTEMLELYITNQLKEYRDNQAKIKYLAHHDVLTGLPNRESGIERLKNYLDEAKAQQTKIAVLFINLDQFKTVNDSLGHHIGDRLLKIIALRIRTLLPQHATVARFGGDEFLALIPNLQDEQELHPLLETLLAAIAQKIQVDGYTLSITPSIGISIFPRNGCYSDELIKNADSALHVTKEKGRNAYEYFTEELHTRIHQTLTMDSQLRQAIVREEFTLHYQPQVQASTGKIIGTEALVRWNHPSDGLVMPDKFIKIAEQRGLIGPLGQWVMHEACRQNKQWQDQGLGLFSIAVNLSPLQFRQGDLVHDIAAILRKTGLEGRYLELELTESVLMDDSVNVVKKLEQLKSLGITIAIDDFGTGYSSLSYLKRYPIDKLKIDRSFVMEIPENQDDVAITSAIINMAKSLRLSTIAEGVETAGQMAFLRALGCDEIQGYFISRPLSSAVLEQHLKNHDFKV